MAERSVFNLVWDGQVVSLTEGEIKGSLPPLRLRILAQEQFSQHMDLMGYHGIRHWMKVLENGLILARLNGANPKVLAHFAFFHDCQRQDEGADKFHGERAADFVKTIRGDFELTDSEFSLLERAIRLHHRRIYEDPDITVMSCWDADRLNLLRVGTRPDPRYLCTPGGRDARVIAWANEQTLNMWRDEKDGTWF